MCGSVFLAELEFLSTQVLRMFLLIETTRGTWYLSPSCLKLGLKVIETSVGIEIELEKLISKLQKFSGEFDT